MPQLSPVRMSSLLMWRPNGVDASASIWGDINASSSFAGPGVRRVARDGGT